MDISRWLGLVLTVGLILGLALGFGCAQAGSRVGAPLWPEQAEDGELSGTLTIHGAWTLVPVVEELASAFMDENPDVDVEVSGCNTATSIEACDAAEIDIGMAARELTPDDPELIAHEVCRYALVILVNPENPVSNLAMDQLAEIFAGEITNWSEVGWKDEDIVVVSREEGAGTRKFFENEVGEITDDAVICDTFTAVRDEVAGEPLAIGYVSSPWIEEEEVEVSLVALDSVEPTRENFESGDYPLLCPLYFLHRPPEPSPNKLIRAFIESSLGDEGQGIVEEVWGYIPIS